MTAGRIFSCTLLAAIAALALASCSKSQSSDANTAPTIAPGIYGNVAMSGETGDLGGIELNLPQGSLSEQVEFTQCEGWCNHVERLPVRQGFGGISFVYSQSGASGPAATIAVQPAADGVSLTVDWGNGPQTYALKRLQQPFGLNVAKEAMAGGDGSQAMAGTEHQPPAMMPPVPAAPPSPQPVAVIPPRP